MEPTILIVEKDRDYSKFLQKLLLDNGYKILTAFTGAEALSVLEKTSVNLIISSFYLTDIRGDSFYNAVNEDHPNTFTIFVSSKADVEIISQMLANPNVDYMVKPIVNEELLARVQVYINYEGCDQEKEETLKVKSLELDPKTFRALKKGKAVYLSPTEFKLLKYLIINKNRVLTREMILNRVWEYTFNVSSRIVDVYIGYLRDKLEKDSKEELIETVRGFGYRIKD